MSPKLLELKPYLTLGSRVRAGKEGGFGASMANKSSRGLDLLGTLQRI